MQGLFSINFLEKGKELLHKVISFEKYQNKKKVARVFIHIGLDLVTGIPTFVLFGFIAILYFLVKIVTAPLGFLHSLAESQGQKVRHASEAVIYLVSWPIIFLLYVFMAFIQIAFCAVYAVMFCFGWLWSLCAFSFNPLVE